MPAHKWSIITMVAIEDADAEKILKEGILGARAVLLAAKERNAVADTMFGCAVCQVLLDPNVIHSRCPGLPES